TSEALADLLGQNPRGLLLHRDELTGWARAMNQYKGGKGDDREAFLSSWSGEPISINRKGRHLYVARPFLSVSGNLPPDMLSELNDEQGREDGFVHRLLLSWPEAMPGGWSEAEPDESVVMAYCEFFDKLYRLDHYNPPPHVMRTDPKPWPHTIHFTTVAKD